MHNCESGAMAENIGIQDTSYHQLAQQSTARGQNKSRVLEWYKPGRFLYNKRCSVVLVPAIIPLLYMGGKILFGAGTLCMLFLYLMDSSSIRKRKVVVTYIMCFCILQIVVLYSLIPLLWKSLFNIVLLFLYNVFIILTGGLGLLQFKQLRVDEPQLTKHIEYILFVSYPAVGLLIMLWVSSALFGLHVAPWVALIYGFILVHLFVSPTKSSFVNTEAVHRPGEEQPGERMILRGEEKFLGILNFVCGPFVLFMAFNFIDLLSFKCFSGVMLCLVLPLFLITFLDVEDVRDAMDIAESSVQRLRMIAGISSFFFLTVCLYMYDIVSQKLAFFLVPLVLLSACVGLCANNRNMKAFHYGSSVAMILLYLFVSVSSFWQLNSLSSVLPHWAMLLCLTSLSILSVLIVCFSTDETSDIIQLMVIAQSVGFVFCEYVLMEDLLYPVYLSVFTASVASYLVFRLYESGKLEQQTALGSLSVHGSKLCIIPDVLGFSAFPGVSSLSVYLRPLRTIGALLFVLVVSKLYLFEPREKFPKPKYMKYLFGLGGAVILVYDSIIFPVWLFVTQVFPSMADIIGGVLIVWGVLCIKLTFYHQHHDKAAKKVNLSILIIGVSVLCFDPSFNVYLVIKSFYLYLSSLVSDRMLSAEETEALQGVVIPWLMIESIVVLSAIMLNVFDIKSLSGVQRLCLSIAVGVPAGHWMSVMLLPVTTPVLIGAMYTISTCVVVDVLLQSWCLSAIKNLLTMYISLYSCLFVSIWLEYYYNLDFSKVTILNDCTSGVLFYAALHIVLALVLRSKCFHLEESLEEASRHRKPVINSLPFFVNVSTITAFLLLTWNSPVMYREFYFAVVSCVLLLVHPVWWDSRPVSSQHVNVLPMYIGIITLLYVESLRAMTPTQVGFSTVFRFLLDTVLLHGNMFICWIFFKALLKNFIVFSEEWKVVVTAPCGIALLLFGGSYFSAQILGVVGVLQAYWLFYYVKTKKDVVIDEY